MYGILAGSQAMSGGLLGSSSHCQGVSEVKTFHDMKVFLVLFTVLTFVLMVQQSVGGNISEALAHIRTVPPN